jgi:probable F420-dependent oxidoreductase
MKFGIMFGNMGPFGMTGAGAKALVQAAEDVGIESVWTVEHVLVPEGYESPYPYSKDGKMGGPDDMPIPDSFTWLSYVAALTSTLKLATGVAILPQRNVVYTAKEIATLDQLSGGRVILGVGTGWMREEFEAVGVPFERRGARTDEYIRVLRALWGDEKVTFEGEFVRLDGVYCRPQPVNRTVPIVIGGHSDASARRAGRLGDGYFPGRGDTPTLTRILGIMRQAAEDVGRDPDAIEVSVGGRPDPASIEALRALGVSRFMLAPPAMDAAGIRPALERFAEDVIAKVE